jgi:putative hydrolases of HD superfamily
MSLLDFLLLAQNLKVTKRTGWVNHGVDEPESIADHMHRMSLIALLLPLDNLNIDRDSLIKMALVHDVAEAVVGDIIPGAMSREAKFKLERNAMQGFAKQLGYKAEEMVRLWEEYEAGVSQVAIVCKVIFTNIRTSTNLR